MCFVRRADRQVQVNGTRVELDEIEGAAALVAGVAGSVATFVEDGSGVGSGTPDRRPEFHDGARQRRASCGAPRASGPRGGALKH